MTSIMSILSNCQDALSDEIIASKKNVSQRIALTDGQYLGSRNSQYLYSFTAETEILFPDDSQVTLIDQKKHITAILVSSDGFIVIVAVETPLRDDRSTLIPQIFLSSEPWFLIKELKDRLTEFGNEIQISRRDHHVFDEVFTQQPTYISPLDNQLYQTIMIKALEQSTNPHEPNNHQTQAICSILHAPATFVWGPPGTGKTSTLGLAVASLLEQGCSVLIAAHSNVAVDVALLSTAKHICQRDGYEYGQMIRAGIPAKSEVFDLYPYFQIKTLVERYYPDEIKKLRYLEQEISRLTQESSNEYLDEKSKQDLINQLAQYKKELEPLLSFLHDIEKHYLQDARLVACTLSKATITTEIYTRRFDVVILDEASMAYVPHCVLLSILAIQRMAIFGDFLQLAPIAQANTIAAQQWLHRDIFAVTGITEKVKNRCDDPRMILLATQYRMQSKIASIINTLFYQGRLNNGPQVDDETLKIKQLEPVIDESVVTYNLNETWTVIDPETKSHFNLISALLSISLACLIYQQYQQPIGIVTPYRAQARLLSKLAHDLGFRKEMAIIATVHRFQGSENDVIIFDLTDSKPLRKASKLLDGEQYSGAMRLGNVAISRARGKSIIVAEHAFFNNYLMPQQSIRQLLTEVKNVGTTQNGSIVELAILIKQLNSPIVQTYRSLPHAHEAISKDVKSTNDRIIIYWPTTVNRSHLVWAIIEKNCPQDCQIFLRGDKSLDILRQIISNSDYYEGRAERPPWGLIICDSQVLWLLADAQGMNMPVIRLQAPALIKLLIGFLGLLPDNIRNSATITERVAQGQSPLGAQCHYCQGTLWLEDQYRLKCLNCGKHTRMTSSIATDLAILMKKVCPKCGGQLRGRSTGATIILGCSDFPRCGGRIHIKDLV